MSNTRRSRAEETSTVNFRLLPITSDRSPKSQKLLKMTILCHTANRVEAYKFQTGLMQLQLPTIRPSKQPPRCICGVGVVSCTRNAGKGQYNIDTDILQLQVGGRRGTSSLQLSRLLARRGRDAKEKVTESAQDYIGKGVLFQPHRPRTARAGAAQQHTATIGASSAPRINCLRIRSSLGLCKDNELPGVS
jgi:hypothetical protein